MRDKLSCDHIPVRIEPTDFSGVFLMVPEPFHDDRGLFTRTFDAAIFDEHLGRPGAAAEFAQDSQSRSHRGVVRGMHGRAGRGEAKLVRCARGAVHDDMCYRIDRPHDPAEDISVAFTDPDLAIAWPHPVTIVSPRDAAAGTWKELLATLG